MCAHYTFSKSQRHHKWWVYHGQVVAFTWISSAVTQEQDGRENKGPALACPVRYTSKTYSEVKLLTFDQTARNFVLARLARNPIKSLKCSILLKFEPGTAFDVPITINLVLDAIFMEAFLRKQRKLHFWLLRSICICKDEHIDPETFLDVAVPPLFSTYFITK